MFLLDTNVVSEIRKVASGRADAGVSEWSRAIDAELLHISAVTVQELEAGVLRIERRDPEQGLALRHWYERQVLPTFADRTLPVDTAVARRCATLHVPDPKPYRDSLIAATALVHGLTLVSRNARDFEAYGLKVFNPWR